MIQICISNKHPFIPARSKDEWQASAKQNYYLISLLHDLQANTDKS
jgi:hypothetical protein